MLCCWPCSRMFSAISSDHLQLRWRGTWTSACWGRCQPEETRLWCRHWNTSHQVTLEQLLVFYFTFTSYLKPWSKSSLKFVLCRNWLPIAQRIDYKCALLCFKCIHGVAPHYLREILNFYKPRRSLRSTEDSFVLETPKTKLKSFGDRAFSSYGPRIWNSLPKRIRDIDKIEIFKKQLKHHLFLKTLCEE